MSMTLQDSPQAVSFSTYRQQQEAKALRLQRKEAKREGRRNAKQIDREVEQCWKRRAEQLRLQQIVDGSALLDDFMSPITAAPQKPSRRRRPQTQSLEHQKTQPVRHPLWRRQH